MLRVRDGFVAPQDRSPMPEPSAHEREDQISGGGMVMSGCDAARGTTHQPRPPLLGTPRSSPPRTPLAKLGDTLPPPPDSSVPPPPIPAPAPSSPEGGMGARVRRVIAIGGGKGG